VSIPTSSSLRVRIVFDGLKFETLLHCITHSYDDRSAHSNMITKTLTLPTGTASRLKEATYMLQSADVVRLRSRKNPGAPDCYHVLFSHQMHLLPVLARLSSTMWLEDEELRTQFATIEQCENESLCAQSNEAEWTNNPFLARLSWILDYVVPIAQADYATLGSSANLETPLREIPFLWSDQNFRVVQTRGMFTHDDVDKPMEEQSWPCGLLHVRMMKKEGLK